MGLGDQGHGIVVAHTLIFATELEPLPRVTQYLAGKKVLQAIFFFFGAA